MPTLPDGWPTGATNSSSAANLVDIRRRPDGCLEYRAGDGANAEWRQLCSPLWVLALTRGADGRNWGRLIEVEDPDGHTHRLAMPAYMLAKVQGDGYRERLYDFGCLIEHGPKAAQALHRYLSSLVDLAGKDLPRVLAAARIGWHGRAFVLPEQSLGGSGEVFQAPSDFRAAVRSTGTLEGWQEHVSTPATGNSRLVFAISAALAAPLLRPLRLEGFILHLRGPSSVGKTTALDVAGSVWGGGGLNGYRQSWQATANGIEAMAEAHCDLLLCLDELGLVAADDAARIAYQLTSGTGKQRALVTGSGASRLEWRVLVLSTGEISLPDKLREARTSLRQMAGQSVRMIDIPADAGRGLGCFECIPDRADKAASDTAKERGGSFARRLTDAATRFYGSAGPAFVQAFINDGEIAESRARRTIQQFMDGLEVGVDGQVQRVAQRFGLVAAAGELAIAYGVVSWPPGQAISAARTCFAAWLEARGDHGPSEVAEAIAHLQATIERDGASRFQRIRSQGETTDYVPNRWGFWRESEEFGREYLFTRQMWRELMAGRDPARIARELADRCILKRDSEGRPNPKERIPGHKHPERFYVVRHSVLSAVGTEVRDAV